MGLDITAYRGLREADEEQGDESLTLVASAEFADRAREFTRPRNYVAAESFDFRAGSYSGYSAWREQLARLARYPHTSADDRYAEQYPHATAAWTDPEETRGLPFWELINFTDCDGVLGTQVAAKLAQDFAALQSKADAHPDEYFRTKYAAWRKACEMASDRGAIEFH